ncbi:hypothetical protein BDV98DRAFT_499855 [Pterulicium gracile]|uniref:Phospholipid/glycerol acyltransferase domain-containing protein n=1 Tax=Pterulicium gracile TaxID=1884261 RepID=A0A5C3QUU3_9AGAR|nr:hypothetical protein BDV98DRAFT_499855 [Pterula gracilis]
MEKFSAFRDAGTGIQPFLTPLHTSSSTTVDKLWRVIGYPLAMARTAIVLALLAVYVALVNVLCLVFIPIRPLYRGITCLFTAILTRVVLAIIGLPWISVEQVSRKRGRSAALNNPWTPGRGDLIVSNWVSWIDILYLAFRFDPIFVFPIAEASLAPSPPSPNTPISSSPGRRTGTGSANVSAKNRDVSTRVPIRGFVQVSLLRTIGLTGRSPPFFSSSVAGKSLHEIRKEADRPIVVFPECTSSNGRGLIRFANILPGESLPVKGYQVFVMCFRYDPPTPLTPTLTHSMTSPIPLNPLSHLFRICTSPLPSALSVRLLSMNDSPSSGLFMVSDVAPGAGAGGEGDEFSECCAALIAQLGKMKRTGMGWEDKVAFEGFYKEKRKLY